MGSIFIGIVMVAGSSITYFTAALSARKPHPTHPLVENHCPPAVWLFGAASVCHLIATILLLLDRVWWGVLFGFIGLFLGVFANTWAKQPELTLRQFFALH